MLELLGRQNSTSCAFVIGCAGSGKTQFLLTMARQCATAAISDSQVLVPVFLKPGFCSGAFDTAESQSRVVEDLVRHSVCALVCGNGMRAEDISAADLSSLDGAGNASTGNRGCMSPSAFADALIKSLLALCLSRRLLVIYDANDLGHRADAAALFRACKAGCHIVISGHDNSIMDAWAIEACNSSLKTAHALPSLQLIMLQPLRGSTVISGVECDPVCLLGERSCAGIRSWWLLQNAVRFLMTTTPHNRHIATGRIPPFGPALRLQTWNRLIFDSMNWNTARLNAHALVYADASPSATNVSFECVRDTLLLLGRVAFSQKVKGNCVTDASFVQWLMEMPAFVGCSAPAAWAVLLALKRSGTNFVMFEQILHM
jgi:intracellular sulfur oxidation DsrE/DsrF family protein